MSLVQDDDDDGHIDVSNLSLVILRDHRTFVSTVYVVSFYSFHVVSRLFQTRLRTPVMIHTCRLSLSMFG